jgi:hypothetical protein
MEDPQADLAYNNSEKGNFLEDYQMGQNKS